MNLKLTGKISDLSTEEDGHLAAGIIELFGVDHHIRLIRVRELKGLIEPYSAASEIVWDLFRNAQAFYEGAYHPVEVPGLPGYYVCFIFPYTD